MERSIENIWKEGFLKNKELLAPKIENLYQQKSKLLVDKMQKMFVQNLWIIFGMATLFLIASILWSVPLVGILLFVIFSLLAFIGTRQMRSMYAVDKSSSSYEYLVSFRDWLRSVMVLYTRIYRVAYPAVAVSFILGFWYSTYHEKLVQKVLELNSEISMFYDMPVILWVMMLVLATFLAIFARSIYRLDIDLVYGHVFRKLDELIADMEELRKENGDGT